MFDNKKILTIIRFYIVPLVLVPLLIFAIFMTYMKVDDYNKARKVNAEMTINGISAVFNNVNDAVVETIKTYSGVEIFQNIDALEENKMLIYQLINGLTLVSDTQDIIFGAATGEFFSENNSVLPNDYDPRFRPWYLEALKTKEVIITEPYLDAREDVMWTMTYALRVENDDGQITGVLGTDLKLKGIEEALNKFFKNFIGRILILDKNSRIIFEKNNDNFFMVNSEDIAFELIKKDGYDIPIKYEGEEYRMDKGTIESLGWEIVLLTPSDMIIKDLVTVFRPLIFIVMLSFLILNLFLFVLKKDVILPLEVISGRIDEVSIREHSDEVVYNASIPKELHVILDSINRMLRRIQKQTHALQEQKEEINGQYEEINALYEETTAMNESLNDLVDEIQGNYRNTIYALSSAIEANDAYTKGHCDRVKDYALKLGEACGLSFSELQTLEYAAILHDIGKVGIPESILNKPSRLTDEEFEIIKSHPSVGARILKDIPYLSTVCQIIEQHHERVDGRGYPKGLKEAEISSFAQILCIVDAYDAMTSKRPYRSNSMTVDEAIEELRRSSATQFSRRKVEVFIEILQNEQKDLK